MNTITTLDEFLSRLAGLGIDGELKEYEQIFEQSDIEALSEHGAEFTEVYDGLVSFIQSLKERELGRKIWWLDNDFDHAEDEDWIAMHILSPR